MPPPEKKKTFLVVDDEEVVRNVLRRYFTAKGIRVIGAADGKEALELAEREKPDLILLDIRMPGMDGMEALRRLRVMTPGTPVIMITANEDMETARQTLALGAKDYVQKPIDLDYLDASAGWLSWLKDDA